MAENTKPQRKSYAKACVLEVKGEVLASQMNMFGGHVSSVLIKTEGSLPQLLDVRSSAPLKVGPFSEKVRLMVDGAWLQEKKK